MQSRGNQTHGSCAENTNPVKNGHESCGSGNLTSTIECRGKFCNADDNIDGNSFVCRVFRRRHRTGLARKKVGCPEGVRIQHRHNVLSVCRQQLAQ